MDIKPCPCGKTPTKLCIYEGETFKWRRISGDCCAEWEVETRVPTLPPNNTPEGIYQSCVKAWNEAPRGF